MAGVSIPQRSDLNQKKVSYVLHVWQVSIPQRSDLNLSRWCPAWVRSVVSIPQRSDLNPPPLHRKKPPCTRFNPATVWFEQNFRQSVNQFHWSFNPATVWFEHPNRVLLALIVCLFQSRNGLIWTWISQKSRTNSPNVSIPQRSDLNAYQSEERCFQIIVSIPQRSDLNWVGVDGFCYDSSRFNPATVWFEPTQRNRRRIWRTCFNPATVWFERSKNRTRYRSFNSFNPATVWFELK